ncbi:MAG: hypothetical protein H0W85_03235 [Methylotenera sp.]|nr:hypothetical protein [Methylotenera sp.]
MHAITPQIIPTIINPAIPSALINPYQKHSPAKGEELDEFINGTDEEDDDYEQTESTINQPKTKFPDDDSNTGDNPTYPETDEVVAEDGDDEDEDDDDDDDEIVTSIGN